MNKVSLLAYVMLIMGAPLCAMQQAHKPAMQNLQHKLAMTKKHDSRLDISFSRNQTQCAALASKASSQKTSQTTNFYCMPCKTGTACVVFTTLMCLAAIQPAHGWVAPNGISGPGNEVPAWASQPAYHSDYTCDHNPGACNGVGSKSHYTVKDSLPGGWHY